VRPVLRHRACALLGRTSYWRMLETASGQSITDRRNYRTARLREGPCLFAISHLRAAGAAAATRLQFTAHGVDPTFFSLSRIIPDRLTAIALSCREPPFAENAADEVRSVRGASAPGLGTGRGQLQRFVRRLEHIRSTCAVRLVCVA
jgi:hypothetical protein